MNMPPPPKGIVPHLTVKGADNAIAFYKKAFGAEELFRHPHEMPAGKGIRSQIGCGSRLTAARPVDLEILELARRDAGADGRPGQPDASRGTAGRRWPVPQALLQFAVRAPVAQLDRVPGYEPGGRGFESCRARHFNK